MTLQRQQTRHLIIINFWSMFSSYAIHAILILYLTRPLSSSGLGYTAKEAYAFIGISQATGYLMPILGGYLADHILGLRRSILIGCILLACTYGLILWSSLWVSKLGPQIFIMAYALIPACSALLTGTTSGLMAKIFPEDPRATKVAMTYYYMSINVGALLATCIAPHLFQSSLGPFAILGVAFLGKSTAALNFLKHYHLYDDLCQDEMLHSFNLKRILELFGYFISVYILTIIAYSFMSISSIIVSIACIAAMIWFIKATQHLPLQARLRQWTACLLMFEAIAFFIIYNQMNSTLILFAKDYVQLHWLGLTFSPAHYQLINPLCIILIGFHLTRFYEKYPQFSIPYQFALGTFFAGLGLFVLVIGIQYPTQQGLVSSPIIFLTYLLITLAELMVSSVGLTMIGRYCDTSMLGFAMGAWYLSIALSYIASGYLAHSVARPHNGSYHAQGLNIFKTYYLSLSIIAILLSIFMAGIAAKLQSFFSRNAWND